MTEYWLQKKTIGGWSMVTWYATEGQARANYDKMKQQIGYSYRLCKVEEIEVDLLNDIVPVPVHDIEYPDPEQAKANVWGGQLKPNADTWGSTKSNWGDLPADSQRSNHGLSGSVWVIHHAKKEKLRVSGDKVDSYLANGYERGGPRTQFRT